MIQTIRFYYRDGFWFADLPEYIEQGGEEVDCMMVAGADTWLDFLAKEKDSVHLKMSTDEPLSEKIILYNDDAYGADYFAYTYKGEDINHQLWLCPITLFVFDKYPETIYYENSSAR